MRRFVMLDKKIGETPLEALTTWKTRHPQYRDVAASYAGRLDPMASGKLLILLGDECKRQKEYTKLDKTYDVEVLLDIASDTGDILGIIEKSEQITVPSKRALRAVLEKERGTYERTYPVFSSKTVNGKPLFLYALTHTLDSIEIPTHPESIRSIRMRGVEVISSRELERRVTSLLAHAPTSDEPSKALGADFRITDVRKSWDTVWSNEREYRILRLRVSCGSGTYMRSLAGRIGASLGTGALALSIHRTRIALPIGMYL